MNKAPAFQFYPDKWQSHTKRLSNTAYRVYHEIICWMWQHSPDQCSIEQNPEAIACAIAMRPHVVRKALSEIQNRFSPLLKQNGARFVSGGLQKEIHKQSERRNKNSENANKRWQKDMQSHGICNAKSENSQCSSSPIPIPTPTSASQDKNTPTACEVEFDVLWGAYPSKTGRQKAFESWKKWHGRGDSATAAIEGIERYKKYVEQTRATGFKDLKYQNGATFFKNREWMSEWSIEAAKPARQQLPQFDAAMTK